MEDPNLPQKKQLNTFFVSRRKALIVALIVLLVFLPGAFLWQARYEIRRIEDLQARVTQQVTPYSFLLTNAIGHRMMLMESISAFIQVNIPDIEESNTEDIDPVIEGLRLSSPGVELVTIAPKGIIQYVHPQRDNESIIGMEISKIYDSQEMKQIDSAIASDEITLGFPSRDSGEKLHVNVYKAIRQNDAYWGLIIIKVDLTPVFFEAGLEGISDDFGMAVLDSRGIVVWGDGAVVNQSPVQTYIDLRSDHWILAAAPVNSWHEVVSNYLSSFRMVIGFVVAFFVTVSYYLTRREQRLSENVRVKSAELKNVLTIQQEIERDARSSRNIFQYILDHLPIGVLVITPDHKALLENPASFDIWDTNPSQKHLVEDYQGWIIETGEKVKVDDWPAMRVFREKKPIINDSFIIETFTGKKKIVNNSAVPILNQNGDIEAVAVLIQDITDMRKRGQELRKLNRLLTITSLVNKAMVRTTEEEQLVKEICQIMVDCGGYTLAWVGGIDEQTKIMSPLAWYGHTIEKVSTIAATINPNEENIGPISKALITGETNICRDISTFPEDQNWRNEALRYGFQSLIALPLKYRGQVYGALTLLSNTTNEFDETEVTYLEDLAQDLVFGLVGLRVRMENQRAATRIEELSYFPSEDPNPVVRVDDTGKILYANEAGKILLNYWNIGLMQLIPTEWQEYILEVKQQTKPQSIQTTIGKETYLISVVPIPSKNYVNLYGRDVSDLVEAQRKLEISLQKLEEAQRLAHFGLWETTTDERLTFWSEEVYRIFEIPPRISPPPFEELYPFLTKEDGEWLLATFTEAWQGKSDFSIDLPIHFPDGRVKYINLIGHPVVNENGQSNYLAGTVLDITERENIRIRTQELNKELEDRVKQRTEQLENANKELETFSYSVSHDLKAPLRGIEGYCRLLLEEYYSTMDETGQHYLNSIRMATDNMGKLIEDMLAYSRLERRTFGKNQIDPATIVQTVLYDLDMDIRQKNVRMNVNLEDSRLIADADGLKITLRNLIENAVKFSSKVATPQVDIIGEIHDSDYRFVVKDNGIGFDMKYQDKIFDMFQRLQRVEDYPGTGVGLALVKKAVQRMDGKIWVESAPGRGATFFLSIPRFIENSGEKSK